MACCGDDLTRVSFQTSLFSSQGGSFGTLSVFDRDLTPIIGRSHNKYVGTLLNIDPWAKETFDIKSSFRERKAQGGIRETVHDYCEQPRRDSTPSLYVVAVILNISPLLLLLFQTLC